MDDAGAVVAAESFGAFFQREFARMAALAEAVSGDPSTAEDLAAEAMTRAHGQWHRVGGYDKPGAWVRRVTINLALKRRRRLGRERRYLRRQRAADLVVAAPTEDHPVWAAVADLPEKQRAAVALFYVDDLPVAEIADVLDCSVSAATSHLHKARRQLADRLEGDVR